MPLVTRGGKILTSGGKAVTDPSCCCAPPVPFEPNIECDTINASLSKCGFSPFHFDECTAPFDSFGYTDSASFSGCSAEFFDCATSAGSTVDASALYLTKTVTRTGGSAATEPPSPCAANCNMCGGNTSVTTYDPSDCSTSEVDSGDAITCCEPCFGCNESGVPFLSYPISGTQTLSSEYTTEMLIANSVDDLPDYPDTWDGYCGSIRDLSDDETSFTVQRFRWRVFHLLPQSCYVKMWLRKRFTPEGSEPYGDDDVLTDLPTYVYDHHLTSCAYADPAQEPNADVNFIRGDDTEESEPAEDGETRIERKKWSCQFGYEPDDPLDDNTRPDPDIHPNGSPDGFCVLHSSAFPGFVL